VWRGAQGEDGRQTQDGALEECWCVVCEGGVVVAGVWGEEINGAQGWQCREREVLGDKPPQPGSGRAHSVLVRPLS
jgi:hypothetical protein